MDNFKILKTDEKTLTWLQIKQVLNTKNDDDLNVPAFLWKIDNDAAEITGHSIYEIREAEEDHINPSGEGIEPISAYSDESNEFINNEPVVYKQGALLGFIS